MIGMYRRRERLLSQIENKKSVIVSFEQSRIESGFISSSCPVECVDTISRHAIQSLLLPAGYARTYGLSIPSSMPMIVQLSTASKHAVPSWNRTIVCSVLEALRAGADAVSLQLAIGNDYEEKMLQDFGAVSEEAHSYGLPVLLSIIAKGDRIVQEYDRTLIADSILFGSELGADVIAVPYSGHAESFTQAVNESTSPVLLAGTHGAASFDGYCEAVSNGLNCGAEGVIVPFQILPTDDRLGALDKINALSTIEPKESQEAQASDV